MNERIAELAKEAGIDAMMGERDNGEGVYVAHPYYEAWPEQLLAFAKLVAKDCAEAVEHEPQMFWNQQACVNLANSIRERYGL